MSWTVRETMLKALEGKQSNQCVGRSSYKVVDKTRREIARDYVKAQTTHTNFPFGSKLGFAAAILKPVDYICLHNNAKADPERHLTNGWTFTNPNRLAPYDETITGQMLEATRNQREANGQGCYNNEMNSIHTKQSAKNYYRRHMMQRTSRVNMMISWDTITVWSKKCWTSSTHIASHSQPMKIK